MCLKASLLCCTQIKSTMDILKAFQVATLRKHDFIYVIPT